MTASVKNKTKKRKRLTTKNSVYKPRVERAIGRSGVSLKKRAGDRAEGRREFPEGSSRVWFYSDGNNTVVQTSGCYGDYRAGDECRKQRRRVFFFFLRGRNTWGKKKWEFFKAYAGRKTVGRPAWRFENFVFFFFFCSEFRWRTDAERQRRRRRRRRPGRHGRATGDVAGVWGLETYWGFVIAGARGFSRFILSRRLFNGL